jgi:hypothetical protein
MGMKTKIFVPNASMKLLLQKATDLVRIRLSSSRCSLTHSRRPNVQEDERPESKQGVQVHCIRARGG